MLSKACVIGAYQRKLEEMARLPDIDLRVLVPPSWRDDRGDLALERAHVNGYDLRVTPIRFNGHFHTHYYPQFGAEVRAFRPDIVHIDEEPYNLATWHALWHARRTGARTLFFSWQNLARRYPPPIRWLEQWVLRTVDDAIMGTSSAAATWRAKGYRGPLAVVPQFGVDPAIFAPPVRPRHDACFVVGFAGRLREEKGGADLLHALATLPHERWRLAIAGDGPERAALAALARELGIGGSISFETRPSVEMPAFYQSIDVLVVPSHTRRNWKEQFGRVIIEAMATGLPVVGSSSGAIPDVIGDAGLIFDEGDRAQLAHHLLRLLDDPPLRRALGQRGQARVQRSFTQQQIAAQTVAVYQRMLARS